MGLVDRLLALLLMVSLLLSPSLAHRVEAQSGDLPPALKTELSERGVSLKTVALSPTKGLETNITDLGRDKDKAFTLDNLQMLKRGIWTSRGIGTKRVAGGTLLAFLSPSPGGFITPTQTVEGYQFTGPDSNGDPQQFVLWQVNDSGGGLGGIWKWQITPAGVLSSSTALLGTVLDSSRAGCFRAFDTTNVIFCHPDKQPHFWDPTQNTDGFLESSNWPVTINTIDYEKPEFVEVFAGRACFAGFEENPQSVVLSVYQNPDAFTVSGTPAATDAGVITFSANLGKITGLKTMRLDNTSNTATVLLVGFEHGFGMITGTDAIDFSSVVVTEEFGLMSNRSWSQIGNETFFLASDGIRKFSTGAGLSTLSNATVSFPIKELTQRINRQYASQAFCVPHATTQELLFWVPIDSSTQNDKAIVLNYNTGQNIGGTIGAPIFSTRSGAAYSCGVTVANKLDSVTDTNELTFLGRYDSGNINRAYVGDAYNLNNDGTGGTAYSWSYVSPLIGGESPLQNCSMRRIDVLTDGPAHTFNIAAYTLTQNAGANTNWLQQDTKTYSVTTASITDLSTWTNGTTSSYPKIIEFQPRGSGRYWAVKVSGSGGQMISFAGLTCVLTLGGLKQ